VQVCFRSSLRLTATFALRIYRMENGQLSLPVSLSFNVEAQGSAEGPCLSYLSEYIDAVREARSTAVVWKASHSQPVHLMDSMPFAEWHLQTN
jgi:hypothetical protein